MSSVAKTRLPDAPRLPRWITFSCFFGLSLLMSASGFASGSVAQAPAASTPPASATSAPVAPSVQPLTAKPAKKRNPDEFPPNPLEITTPDPLLPQTVNQRPLSDTERKRLALALDELNRQASEKLKQRDRVGAFDLWYRELRLRRSLGLLEEVKALGRVGEIAWKENLAPDVRWITKRLDAILAQNQLQTAVTNSASDPASQTTTPPSSTPTTLSASDRANRIAVLEALGLAYQQIRLPQTAANVYQQILTDAKQRRDEQKVDATLITLGQLYINWFNYPNAASTYQELANRAKARGDRGNEIIYLTQLAFVYEQAKQPAPAIAAQQQLVALYEKVPDPKPIPALKIRIGDNYQLLARPDQAEQNYQSAYQLAQSILQLAYASEALQKLGALYRANDRLDAALKVFDYLVSLEQQSYNYYGMMNAYDQIGQIQLARKQNQQALVAFQQGLGLAKQLKYRQDYFTAQIQKIGK
ncbi:MAG: tetratricopeptide repeat protein [Leptolyngbya sp. BL-A-14]